MNDIPPLYSRGGTSYDAALSIEDERLTLRERCFQFIERRGAFGATCAEIEALLGMSHQTASARVWELDTKEQRIVDSGLRRKTGSGRNAIVWIVAPPIPMPAPAEPAQLALI